MSPRAEELLAELRKLLLKARRAKREAEARAERLRLAAACVCLEDAIDRLRGGE